MADPMRIRATNNGAETEVKVLMAHPMETGLRKDSAGKPIPAHYITDVLATCNGKTLLKCQWSQSISQNPFLMFKVTGINKGDKVQISWTDNMGATRTDETTVA